MKNLKINAHYFGTPFSRGYYCFGRFYFLIMNNLTLSFKEYLHALTISKKTLLCWDGKKYVVSWFFSKELCNKLNWEVICG